MATSQAAMPILILAISATGVGAVLSLLLHRIHQRSGLATASDIVRARLGFQRELSPWPKTDGRYLERVH